MSTQWKVRNVSLLAVVLAVFALLAIPATQLNAQTVTGTILGNVFDASGAAVPGAQITVTNQDTGVSRTTTASADGGYTVPALLAGQYTVAVKAQGFTPLEVKDVVVNVGTEKRTDLHLEVGAVSQQVSVTESAPTVETTSADVSQLMEQDVISVIPLNARDLQQLATIQPAVQMIYTASYGKSMSAGGDRIDNNRFLQEGVDMTYTMRQSPVSLASNILMGADAVKEFSVITENPPVEYGEESGGVVNTIFKSGTNNFHGTLFEYYRNSAFDARNFFDPVSGAPPLHRHQFGGSLGGPIKKDKLFFFANFEGFRSDASQSFTAPVPDANARGTGNGFGELPCGTGDGANCPSGTAEGTLVQVPVSTGIYNSFFGGYSGNPGVPLLPACNLPEILNAGGFPTGTCTYSSNPDYAIREYYGLVKSDYTLNASNNLSFTYNNDSSTSNEPSQVNMTADAVYFHRQTGSAQFTHIFSANLVNTLRFGVNRLYYGGLQDLNEPTGDVDPDIYVNPNPNVVSRSSYPAFPQIIVSGIQELGAQVSGTSDYEPRIVGYTSGNLDEAVNWQKGKHAFQFGFQIHRWYDNDQNYQANPRGEMTFPNLDNFLAGGPMSSFTWAITNYTDPLNGVTYSGNIPRGEKLMSYGTYAEDTYKLRPNLTLTGGLRWEYTSAPSETANRVSDLFGPNCNPYTCATPTLGSPWYHPPRDNFAPRVGFNWDPFGKGKTSVRGGAGVFFNELDDTAFYAGVGFQPPYTTSITVPNTVPFPFLNTGSGLAASNSAVNTFLCGAATAPCPNTTVSSTTETFGGIIPDHFKTATKYGMNLAIQQELPDKIAFEVAYVGAQGRHLGRDMSWQDYFPTTVETPGQLPMVNGVAIPGSVVNPDCTAPGQITCNYWAGSGLSNANITGTAPYDTLCATDHLTKNCFNNPNWSNAITGVQNDANSFYNSLQAILERTVATGFLVRFNYTYARCITDSSFDLPTGVTQGGSAAWPLIYDHSAARGRCSYIADQAANLTLGYTTHWGNNISSRTLKTLATDWQITSQTGIQNGLPTTITDGGDVSRYQTTSSSGNDRPNWAAPSSACPNPSPAGAINPNWKTTLTYLNNACFTPSLPGYTGNIGNVAFTGPGLFTTDISLRKTIHINESKSFVFSADMFNAFNRANFPPPAASAVWTSTGLANYEAGTGTLAAAANTTFSKLGINTPYPTVTTSRQFQINGRFVF